MEKETIEIKKEIIEINNFEQFKNSLKAKEGEKVGGLVDISIFRHCRPVSDAKDASLSPEGEDEAKKLASTINPESQIVFIYSPLVRAKRTVEILSKNIQAQKIYFFEEEHLNKPSWNSPEERRFGELKDKLHQKPPETKRKILQMFYGAKSEKAMAEESARKLDDFFNGCVDLASKLPTGQRLKVIAISHQETMEPYLVRRWNLDIGGPKAWEGWLHLGGIKTGNGFRLIIDDKQKVKILEINNRRFNQSYNKLNDARVT